ncbi:SPOR domain-containing protein [Marilutibacter spongiae]|uniref:SPOR domain-containing protein n=1 Tax=Marilutibacter spongiae TaxID=2025720 RepID=A0A7W3TJW9_9GAMM|nr:SPOR domain-containing protein [Lysobacter spongiae]MBB1059712.1 SPOR domain-containing protein [Lysobacter spongiae]
MEPALKQRLIGAIVLVALAVIFLPMLIKGPAPESGVADLPLDMPDAPQGGFETRELPLVTPGATPEGGAVGMSTDGALPTVDTRDAAAQAPEGALPATTAGGDYALGFGTYASSQDAARVIKVLGDKGLPGFQDTIEGADKRTLYRVRIGPYATREEAEAARVVAAGVNPQVDVRVIVLDADAAEPAPPVAAKPEPEPQAPSPATPVATAPATPAPAPKKPEPPKPVPSAPSVGFAVQLAAFSHAEDAAKLRDRARAAGFSAFIESVDTDKGTLSRVRVGPVADRAEAEALKAQLAARLGISGIVQTHP